MIVPVPPQCPVRAYIEGMTGASPRASVVVPTFNSGRHLSALIASLDGQSLPPEEFEVVLVDDGSTDGTELLVDRIAEVRPNVRAAHVPASGWPGKPRNVGVDLARGDYVYFVDHDDHLGAKALERMTGYGREHGSDVVIGREVRVGRPLLAAALFAKNRPQVDVSWEPLWSLRTPHKMFRRQFLLDNGIRFPEGPRRLEDHAFLVPAYFAATTISVLADYTCYYWVFSGDGAHSSTGIDPDSYYPFLEEVLDLIEERTEPGPERDRLLAAWYRTKVLRRINRSVTRWEPDRRAALLRVTTELAARRFADVDPYLPPMRRVLSHLLRTGRMDDLESLTEAITGVSATPRVHGTRWSDGDLVVDVALSLRYADGRPVQLARRGDQVHWVLPEPLDDIPDDLLDVTDAVAEVRVNAIVHNRSDGNYHRLEMDSGLSLTDDDTSGLAELAGIVTLRMAPQTANFGGPLGSGRWHVRVHAAGLGLSTADMLAVERDQLPPPALIGGLPVVPYRSRSGDLAMAVASRDVALIARALPEPADVHVSATATGARLVVDLPRLKSHGDAKRSATMLLAGLPLPATLVSEDGAARIESWFSALPGRCDLELELDGSRTPLKIALDVDSGGRVRPVRAEPRRPDKQAREGRTMRRLRRVAAMIPGVSWAERTLRGPLAGIPGSRRAARTLRRIQRVQRKQRIRG